MKTDAAKRCWTFVDRRFKLYDQLAQELTPFISASSQVRKWMWTSGIDALAGDFSHLFKQRLIKGRGHDLSTNESKCLPSETSDKETIYYLAGYVLWAINKKRRRSKDASPLVFEQLERSASITKFQIAFSGLHSGQVAQSEILSLYYASHFYYDVICTVELVFDKQMQYWVR